MARAGSLVTRRVPRKELLQWLSMIASWPTICTELSSLPLALAWPLTFQSSVPQKTQTGLAKAQAGPILAQAKTQTGLAKTQAKAKTQTGLAKVQAVLTKAQAGAAKVEAWLTTGPMRLNNWAFTLPKALLGKLMWPKSALKRQKTFASTLSLFNSMIIQLNQSSKQTICFRPQKLIAFKSMSRIGRIQETWKRRFILLIKSAKCQYRFISAKKTICAPLKLL